MVELRGASTMFLVVLVVMATTIANGVKPPKDPAAAAPQAAAAAPQGAAAAGAPAGAAAAGAPAAAAGAPAAAAGAPAAAAGAPAGAAVAGAPAGATAAPGGASDVKALGAKGDGTTDDAPAFAAAWTAACGAGGTITVPKGEYLVNNLAFKGPCKGPVTLEMNGNLKAPAKVTTTVEHCGWLDFEGVADFTLNGNKAIFDGNGAEAWKVNDCAKTGKCNTLPINIRFTGLTNARIKDITSTNSKLFHMNIIDCKNMTLENIGIDAPPESLNTDGIHIGRSNGVNILGAKIRTGDDCVSIGDGTENLIVENVECGPGHGIAIGSLGMYPNEMPVIGVTVRKCLIKNTDNGVRIKTWPGSPPGEAFKILFEDITMDNVSTPVLIDQQYCPHGKCKDGPSQVKLTDVTFKGIKGTSATKVAVKLLGSTGATCTNIALTDIELTSTSPEGPAVSACANVKPIVTGKMIPAACTEVATPGP